MALDPIAGFCFPRNNVPGFTATLSVVVFADVQCTQTVVCTGDCDNLQQTSPGCNNPNNCSYTVPCGNLTHTFRFNRVGNEYILDRENEQSFRTKWEEFNARIDEKIADHTLTEANGTIPWSDGSCMKTIPDGVDCNNNPKFKRVPTRLQRAQVTIKTPSLRVNKSINSQAAECNFN